MENYPNNNSSYPESGNSSPRSREIEFENPPPWEDQSNQPPPNYKVKFMCSYGGKIHPRPHDNQLSYIGGETKILSVDRNVKFSSMLSKLMAICESDAISFKYQLPGEDLDALISVTNDDDLEHMMHEYDRLYRISPKPARLRIFIFPSQNRSLNLQAQSFGSDEVKTEKERFVEALNSAPIMTAPSQPTIPVVAPQFQPPDNVDFLFGLEKANSTAAAAVSPGPQPPVGRVQEFEDPVFVPGLDDRLVGSDPIQKHILDLQRLRIEEQQGNYRRKSDDTLTGGGEYYKIPDKISQLPVSGGVPYWTDKQVPGGGFPASTTFSNEQPVYMIQSPSNAYHAPMMRQVNAQLPHGYYAVQRMPTEVYRDQQQIYNMIPQGVVPSSAAGPTNPPSQKVTGYSEGFGMARPATSGAIGMMTEAGYGQVVYDSVGGRHVIYSAPGGVMTAPASVQAAAQYQTVTTDMRSAGGALNAEAGGKVVAKATQS